MYSSIPLNEEKEFSVEGINFRAVRIPNGYEVFFDDGTYSLQKDDGTVRAYFDDGTYAIIDPLQAHIATGSYIVE